MENTRRLIWTSDFWDAYRNEDEFRHELADAYDDDEILDWSDEKCRDSFSDQAFDDLPYVREDIYNRCDYVVITGVVNRWDGPHEVYEKWMLVGKALSSLLSDWDDVAIYQIDERHYDFECRHHDGTNHYKLYIPTDEEVDKAYDRGDLD